MSDYQTRRDQHYDKLAELHHELLGYIAGTGSGVDDGVITAEEALARIREKAAQNSASRKAAWDEYTGGPR